jgi:hypothetical protein
MLRKMQRSIRWGTLLITLGATGGSAVATGGCVDTWSGPCQPDGAMLPDNANRIVLCQDYCCSKTCFYSGAQHVCGDFWFRSRLVVAIRDE